MPKKLFKFPVRRTDTITRANIMELRMLHRNINSPATIAAIITRRELTLASRHKVRVAALS